MPGVPTPQPRRRRRLDDPRATVFVTLPACPVCHEWRDLKVNGTEYGPDTLTRWMVCLACGHRFTVRGEPPGTDPIGVD